MNIKIIFLLKPTVTPSHWFSRDPGLKRSTSPETRETDRPYLCNRIHTRLKGIDIFTPFGIGVSQNTSDSFYYVYFVDLGTERIPSMIFLRQQIYNKIVLMYIVTIRFLIFSSRTENHLSTNGMRGCLRETLLCSVQERCHRVTGIFVENRAGSHSHVRQG